VNIDDLRGQRVTIVEVGPRDGLQNEHAHVSTTAKIAFVDLLSEAHLPVIEVSAFVSPKWVPQMADASEVFAGITRRAGTRYTALVPNLAGLDRAMAAGVVEIAIFAASSETFSRKNINQTIEQSLVGYAEVTARALANGVRVRGYLSTAFGCPYEGDVAPSRVAELTERLVEVIADVGRSDFVRRDVVAQLRMGWRAYRRAGIERNILAGQLTLDQVGRLGQEQDASVEADAIGHLLDRSCE